MYSRIRTVKSGEQITRPGLYRVPIKRYHNDPNLFPGHSVSSTGLRRILRSCPRKYWAYSVHNPKRIYSPTSEALRFGKGVHSFLLERDLPKEEFAYHTFKDFQSNEGKKGKEFLSLCALFNDGRFKSYADFKKQWKFFANWAGLTIVGEKDVKIFKQMALALADEPLIKDNGILSGDVEVTIAWQDPVTGIWVKVRPDVVPDQNMVGDYKAVASAHPNDVEKSITNYEYGQQLALTGEGMARVLSRVISTYYLVNQEKEKPYLPSITPVRNETIYWGFRLNRMALDKISRCLDADDWPTYGDGHPIEVGYQRWRDDQLAKYEERWMDVPEMAIPDIPPISEYLGKV